MMKSLCSIRAMMRITVTVGSSSKDIEVSENVSPMDLLARLCLLPDAHIILREGIPIPIDERLSEGDSLKVIKVASGG